MRKLLIAAGVFAIVGAGVFLYATRDAKAPMAGNNVERRIDNEGAGEAKLPSPITEAKPAKGDSAVSYVVVAKDSQASFEMGETLNGNDITVLGISRALSGTVVYDPSKKGNEQFSFGEFKIPAVSLKTDSARRDGAMARFILKAEEPGNTYVTFGNIKPIGMPERMEGADSFGFALQGDLTVAGVTKPTRFDIVTTLKGNMLTGHAEAKIKRSDFGLVIPNLPFIASVDEEVVIKLLVVAEGVK